MNLIATSLFVVFLVLTASPEASAAESSVAVCGLRIHRSALVKANITPIREDSIRSRVDAERFEACPYHVSIVTGETVMHVDFMAEPVNEDISGESNEPVHAGPFVLLNGTWKMLGGKVPSESNVKIKVLERDGETLVQSSRHRASSSDDCVDFLLIGPAKSATGSACSKSGASLDLYRAHLSELVTFKKDR